MTQALYAHMNNKKNFKKRRKQLQQKSIATWNSQKLSLLPSVGS
jgi:hypothetical protein